MTWSVDRSETNYRSMPTSIVRPRIAAQMALRASAQQAVADGFGAIKAAPFDGFPSLDRPQLEVDAATELGIACIEAMRQAIGPGIDLKIDAHSSFDIRFGD